MKLSEQIREAAKNIAVETVGRVDCAEGVMVAWLEMVVEGYMTPEQLRQRIADKSILFFADEGGRCHE